MRVKNAHKQELKRFMTTHNRVFGKFKGTIGLITTGVKEWEVVSVKTAKLVLVSSILACIK